MAFKLAEMTQETSTNPGAGDYVLNGAVATFRAFVSEMAAGDVTIFTAYDTSAPPVYAEYYGTFQTGPNRLVRTTFIKSSTGTDITWGPGATVNIVAGLPGRTIESLLDPARVLGAVSLTSVNPPIFSSFPVTTAAKTLLDDVSIVFMRATLGVTIGTNVQAWDADLDAIAALAKTSGNVIRANGSAWLSAVLAAADVSHAPTSPVTGTTVQAAMDQLSHPYSRTNQTTAQNDIATATNVALTDLDNLSVPGTGNGTKVYRISGQVSISGFTNDQRVDTRIHVGTAGTVADAVIATVYGQTSQYASLTLTLPAITFTPGSTDRVTVSVNSSQAIDIAVATGETFVVIEQISNA